MSSSQAEQSRPTPAASAPPNRWLVVLFVAGASAAWFWFSYLPRRRAMNDLAAQLAQTKSDIEQSIALVQLRTAIAGELDKVRRYVEECRGRLVPASRAASLFGRIASLAKHSGVVVTRFAPQAPVGYSNMQEVALDAGCLGSLQQVLDWVARLERATEPIWVEKLIIKPLGQDGHLMQVESTIVTFTGSSENSGQVDPAG